MAQSKKKKKLQVVDNPIEAVRELGCDLGQSAKADLVEGTELKPNEAVTLQPAQEGVRREEILSYQNQRQTIESSVFTYQESVKVKKEIEELLKQIKLLAQSTENLTQEISHVSMQEMPVNPGRYHVNFFTWLISLIKSLRQKVEESRSWLMVFRSKKKQKQYWAMFKKHGTSFGLSGERLVATQVS